MSDHIAPSLDSHSASAAIPPLAHTLLRLELIQKADLLDILNNTIEDDEPFIIKIIQQKLVSGAALAEALSRQFGSPLFDLSAFDPAQIPDDLVDISLASKHLILPLFRRAKTLYIAITDPTDVASIEKLQFNTGLTLSTLQCNPLELKKLLTYVRANQQVSLDDFIIEGSSELEYESRDDEAETAIDDLDDSGDSPIIRYINKILIDAINKGASDIHFEPMNKKIRVRYRIDGVLHIMASQPIAFASQILARIKIIGHMDISEKRIPQDGRVKVKLSNNQNIDFRINTLPTVYGEKAVLRILDSSAANLDLASLGLSAQQLAQYKDAVARPYGMVLITGPTGSGKTVTLYSALNMLNTPSKNISTVENPVEIFLDGITQVNTNEKSGLTFSSALRSFLRQDPDIIMLGEIRDLETAEIAVKASQTGHMVLSTLHTNDAPSTLTRLLNMGIPAFNIASSVQLIVAQRLARKLCLNCKKPQENIPKEVLLNAGLIDNETDTVQIYTAEGCDNCSNGYKGRVGVFQVLPVNEKIRHLILKGCTEREIEYIAKKQGVLDLRASGLELVKQGVTSLEEVERVTNA